MVDIKGRKGGKGGGSSTPKEAPNTMKSNAIARFAIAVSEGPIGGLVNGAKSIYLDGTALQAADGYNNYHGIRIEERIGLPSQPKVAGFTAAENVVNLGLNLIKPSPITRTVGGAAVDSVRIIVRFPSLQSVDKKSGDINGTSVQIKFEVKDNAVGFWEDRGTSTIEGKNNAGFQKAFRIARPAGTAVWDFRVTRLTDDSTTNYLANETVIDSFVEIQDGNYTYPNTAYYACTVDTAQFGGNIPTVAMDIDGALVKVPSNYYEERLVSGTTTAAYDGAWNGTWKMAVTDNPIWNLYDVLTSTRYGADQPEDFINKFEMYEAARYCDAVDNGGTFVGVPTFNSAGTQNGLRRRFTFRTQITKEEEALKYMIAIMSSCRGQLYWGAGAIQISMDRPKDASMIFGPENVIDGVFTYGFTAAAERFVTTNVTYNNPDEGFETEIVQFTETDSNKANKVINSTDVTKMGCASPDEALSFAKWYTDTSLTQTQTINFKTGFDARGLRPGDRIDVMDPRVSGGLYAGRIVNVTANSVKLDHQVTLPTGSVYSIVTIDAQGQTLARRTATPAYGYDTPTDLLTVFPAWSSRTIVDKDGNSVSSREAVAGHQYIISGDVQPTSWTVIHVKEGQDFIHEVMAVNYDPTKFARVEQGIILDPPDYTKIELNTVLPPTNIQFKVHTVRDEITGPRNDATITWSASPSKYTVGYRAVFRRNGSQYNDIGTTTVPSITLERIVPGSYEVSIFSYSPTGAESAPLTGTFEFDYSGFTDLDPPLNLRLQTLLPDAVPGISTTPDFNFVWDENPQWEEAVNKPIGIEINIYTNDASRTVLKSYYQNLDSAFVGTFSHSENFALGLFRDIIIEAKTVDGGGRRSDGIELVASNPAPDALANIQLFGGFNFFRLSHNNVLGRDVVGTIVWASKTSGFTPSEANRVAKGTGSFQDVEADANSTYYVRAAAYDTFSDSPSELNVSAQFQVTTVDDSTQVTPPATPTGLTTTSYATKEVVYIRAQWTALAADTYSAYEVSIREGTSGTWFGGYMSATNSYIFSGMSPNQVYQVRVRGTNGVKFGDYSNTSQLTTVPASGTTTTPGQPNGLAGSASFQSVNLTWTNSSVGSISYTELIESYTPSIGAGTVFARVQPNETSYLRGALGTGLTRYYWARHVGPLATGPASSMITVNTLSTVTADYGDLSIVDAKIQTLHGDKIIADTINANKIKAGTILSGSIIVGTGTTTLEQLKNNNGDPVTAINTGTTTIDPGKILISGSTTLANWRNGTDATKIEGGSIATNTITANQVQIGLRGVNIEGINFEANKTTNRATWTTGKISYMNDAGAMTTSTITAGTTTVNATVAAPVYIYWVKGATSLSSTTNVTTANGANNVVMASYIGGPDLIANYGGTIIDGANIRTGTIQASRIEANSIGAGQIAASNVITATAQIGTGIITNAQIANATILNGKIANAAVDTLKIQDHSVTLIDTFEFSVYQISGLTFSYNGAFQYLDYGNASQVGSGNTVQFQLGALANETNDIIAMIYFDSYQVSSASGIAKGSTSISFLEADRPASYVTTQTDFTMISRYNPADTGQTMIDNRIASQSGINTTILSKKFLVSGGSRVFRPVIRYSLESGTQPFTTPQMFGRVMFFRFLR